MEKGAAPSLFVNDGSFMERFKQLQQENEKEKGKGAKLEEPKQPVVVPATSTPNPIPSKTNNISKTNGIRKTPLAATNGKLAFSLKQKSKLVPPPVKLGGDEDEEETDAGSLSGDLPMKRQKLGQKDLSEHPSPQVDVGNYCLYEYPFIWLEQKDCAGLFVLSLSHKTGRAISYLNIYPHCINSTFLLLMVSYGFLTQFINSTHAHMIQIRNEPISACFI